MKAIFKVLMTLLVALVILLIALVGIFGWGVFNDIFGGERFSTEFQLTEQDLTDMKSASSRLVSGAENGATELATILDFNAFAICYQWINTQNNVAYFNYCKSPTDQKALGDYNFANSVQSEASNLYQETLKVLLSKSPHADKLFSAWSEEQKADILNNDPEIHRLNLRNKEITMEIVALDPNAEGWGDKANTLYEEFVRNNNAVAALYGYSNYYDYSSKRVWLRDYGTSDAEAFCANIKSYIVPLYELVEARLTELLDSIGDDRLAEYGSFASVPYHKRQWETEHLVNYYNSFEGNMGAKMKRMFDVDAAFFVDGADSLALAYTVVLDYYGEPIVYFGPGYQNLMTVVHESGHYAALLEYVEASLSIDSCEVHSQSNEWLFVAYLDGKIDEDIYELFLLNRLYVGLSNILFSSVVNEYEMRVYMAETPYTAADYDAVIEDVISGYGEVFGKNAALKDSIKYIVLNNPTYYIGYATSEIASLGLFTVAEDDLAEAMRIYTKYTEDTSLKYSFKEGLEKGGLLDPFSEDTFKFITDTFSKYVEKDGDDALESYEAEYALPLAA